MCRLLSVPSSFCLNCGPSVFSQLLDFLGFKKANMLHIVYVMEGTPSMEIGTAPCKSTLSYFCHKTQTTHTEWIKTLRNLQMSGFAAKQVCHPLMK